MPPKVKKKLNGQRTGRVRGMTAVAGSRQPPPPPPVERDPKLWKKVKDPAGFWKWEKRKTGAKALPPSVRAKREERAKQPPPVKYAGKPSPKTGYKPGSSGPEQLQPRRRAKKKVTGILV